MKWRLKIRPNNHFLFSASPQIPYSSKFSSATSEKYTTGQASSSDAVEMSGTGQVSTSATGETSEMGQEFSSAKSETYTTGLAFSGGGIRSAALCSGVLRRLLQCGVEPDYLSCVSGGGYTGTAYLDWKHGQNRNWHKQFFEHMRSRTGFLCNWQKPLNGCWDTCVIGLLLTVVSIFIPIVGWGSFACPLALFIDLAFGKFLKAERFRCNEMIQQECDLPYGSYAYDRMYIFVFTFIFFIIFHIATMKSSCGIKAVLLLHFPSKFCGSLFAFTFFPWFIHDYLNYTPTWVEAGVVIVSAVMWFFLPFLRRYSSLVIIVYLYSYVIYWHVYDEKILVFKHTESLFLWLLFFSGLVWFFATILGEFHLRLVHIFNR